MIGLEELENKKFLLSKRKKKRKEEKMGSIVLLLYGGTSILWAYGSIVQGEKCCFFLNSTEF